MGGAQNGQNSGINERPKILYLYMEINMQGVIFKDGCCKAFWAWSWALSMKITQHLPSLIIYNTELTQ